MTVVPNVPGIPPLLGATFSQLPTLLTADGVDTGQFSRRWGVFKGGEPVVTFDSFIGIDYRQGWTIADFPLEQGAFESYDKVSLPFDVRVKFAAGGSLENREALLQSVAAISKTLDLYDVVTPEIVYTSVNVQHYDYRRTATNGNGLIMIELWLLEVRIGATQAAASNTIDPSGNSAFNAGGIQSQDATSDQASLIAAGGTP